MTLNNITVKSDTNLKKAAEDLDRIKTDLLFDLKESEDDFLEKNLKAAHYFLLAVAALDQAISFLVLTNLELPNEIDEM